MVSTDHKNITKAVDHDCNQTLGLFLCNQEQRAIERERDKLLMLEERKHQVVQQMRGSTTSHDSFSSSPTTPVSLLNPTAGASDLATLRESLQRELENQRRIFDDLEFQQLEVRGQLNIQPFGCGDGGDGGGCGGGLVVVVMVVMVVVVVVVWW